MDEPILEELKRAAKAEKRSLGRFASDLLAVALRQRESDGAKAKTETQPEWISKTMSATIDLRDQEALFQTLDQKDDEFLD